MIKSEFTVFQQISSFLGHERACWCLRLLPEHRIVSNGQDKKMKLWDYKSKVLLWEVKVDFPNNWCRSAITFMKPHLLVCCNKLFHMQDLLFRLLCYTFFSKLGSIFVLIYILLMLFLSCTFYSFVNSLLFYCS